MSQVSKKIIFMSWNMVTYFLVSNRHGVIEFRNIHKDNVKQLLFIYGMGKIFWIFFIITPFQQSNRKNIGIKESSVSAYDEINTQPTEHYLLACY